jgi:hypothetical protein
METTTEETTVTPGTLHTVTGTTESKLDLVRSYNISQPFQVGVNGVTEVTEEYVVYTIDNIAYRTTLSSGETTYSLNTVGFNADNSVSRYIVKRDTDVFSERHATRGEISLDRKEMSVFDAMYKISSVNSVDDFANYIGNN